MPDADAALTPRVLLFELEGVVVDTRDARRAALADALRSLDLTLPDELLAESADGRTEVDAVLRALAVGERSRRSPRELDDTDVELVTLRTARAFEARLEQGVTLVPGARDALQTLAARLRLGVVTRLAPSRAEHVLAVAELDAVVGCTVARGAGGAWPTPDAFGRAFARLALTPANGPRAGVALVDGAPMLAAARAAGLLTVGVGPGAQDAGADAWLASAGALTYDALMDLLASRRMPDS